jgi:peptidoglycan/LPS O-acetylase OafA/YrhL
MKTKLIGLEAGRFVAALLVCCFHFSLAFENLRADPIFDMAFRAGHAGVDYFFVLSGFIIFYIHRSDIDLPQKVRAFALKRIIRIYPLYWLIFFAMLLVFSVMPSLKGNRDLTLVNLLLDALILPKPGDSVVSQSWSLGHEMVFYAFFCLSIYNRRIGFYILLAWQAGCLIIGSLYPYELNPIVKPFFYIYNLGFGAGMLTAWAIDKLNIRFPGLLAILGISGFAAAMAVEWKIGRFIPEDQLPLGGILSPAIYMACSAIIIFSVTKIEMSKPLPFAKALQILGGSSYCIYLIHAPLGSFLIRLFDKSVFAYLPNSVVFSLMVILTIIVSIFTHELVEKPMMRYLRSRLIYERRQEPVLGI